MQRLLVRIGLVFVALASSGCVSSILAKRAVKAPNLQNVPRVVRDAGFREPRDKWYAQQWKLSVGPPAAELSVAVIEPGDYQGFYNIEVKQNDKGHRWLEPTLRWTMPARTRLAVRGTVLLLHGYMDSKEDVLHWALYLAERGYRCVLVDFRGHGRSTGKWIGFGAFEARDLSQVLDDLEKRSLLVGRAGVLGVSYGGSTAILLAARDPRVGAVVALEPYSSAETAIVEFAHGVAPQLASKISRATFASAVAKAPKVGGFSWGDADVAAAAERVTVPVLLIHGAKDTWISVRNSETLLAKLGGKKALKILPEDGHLLLSMRLAPIHEDVLAWFQDALK